MVSATLQSGVSSGTLMRDPSMTPHTRKRRQDLTSEQLSAEKSSGAPAYGRFVPLLDRQKTKIFLKSYHQRRDEQAAKDAAQTQIKTATKFHPNLVRKSFIGLKTLIY